MTVDRTVRRLSALQESASTTRVLNLAGVQRRNQYEPEVLTPPFFDHPLLNRCIILKHRVRANELDQFRAVRQNATKILLPIDPNDLKLGAAHSSHFPLIPAASSPQQSNIYGLQVQHCSGHTI